jgi:hypothetical protein
MSADPLSYRKAAAGPESLHSVAGSTVIGSLS